MGPESAKFVCTHPDVADPTGLLHLDPCCTAPRSSLSEGDMGCTGYISGQVIERALDVLNELNELGMGGDLAPGFDHLMYNTACKDGAIEAGYAANGDEVRNLRCPSRLFASNGLASKAGMKSLTHCDADGCNVTVPWRQTVNDDPELAQRLINVRQGECSAMIDQRDDTTPEMAQHCQKVWTDALQPTVHTGRNVILPGSIGGPEL